MMTRFLAEGNAILDFLSKNLLLVILVGVILVLLIIGIIATAVHNHNRKKRQKARADSDSRATLAPIVPKVPVAAPSEPIAETTTAERSTALSEDASGTLADAENASDDTPDAFDRQESLAETAETELDEAEADDREAAAPEQDFDESEQELAESEQGSDDFETENVDETEEAFDSDTETESAQKDEFAVEEAAAAAEPTDAPKTVPKTAAKPAKTPAAKPARKKADPNRTSGKWKVIHLREGEYVAELYANNGELLLSSEIYSTAEGARNGIETILRNIILNNFSVYKDKNDNYFYKLKTAGNRLLCVGETYPTRTACESAIESVKKFSKTALIQSGVEEPETVVEYTPKPTELVTAKAGYTGKWIIKESEGLFTAYLKASNGELLLASEPYSSAIGAKNGMETIKKAAFSNNFVIDMTKNGKYCYKLRNANKLTLCVGEAYDTQTACEQSIDSVKKFCQTAVLEAPKRAASAAKAVPKAAPKTGAKSKTASSAKPAAKKPSGSSKK